MLYISQSQVNALRSAQIDAYQARVEETFRKFFPPCYLVSRAESDLGALIRRGVQAAVKLGICSEYDTCKYLALLIIFGDDFDSPPRPLWAQSILNERPPVERLADVLYSEAARAALDESTSGATTTTTTTAHEQFLFLASFERHLDDG